MTAMCNGHILIVDDNPMNLKLARVLLTAAHYAVDVANNAEEAQEKLAISQPRVILMDIQLPGMDGLALTRQIKAHPDWRHIVVIALTAFAMKGDAEKARAAGCDGYITKPIDTRTFVEEIASYLKSDGESTFAERNHA